MQVLNCYESQIGKFVIESNRNIRCNRVTNLDCKRLWKLLETCIYHI